MDHPVGVRHVRIADGGWEMDDVRGVQLPKLLVFEGDHGVESAFFRLGKGQSIPTHIHHLWVQVMVIDGCLHVDQDGAAPFDARAGSVYFLDPGHRHVETAVEDSLVLVTQGDDRVFPAP